MNRESDARLVTLEVLKKFRLIYGSVRHHSREVQQHCGVSGTQLWLLNEVAETPYIGITELADRLSIHQSTCSQLVEKLVTRCLIIKERSRVDQRRVGLRVSKAAALLLATAPGPAQGVLPGALMALHPDAQRNLDDALAGVIAKFRRQDPEYAKNPLADR